MANSSSISIIKENLLSAIRAVVKKAGGAKPPTFLTFLGESGVTHSQFYKHFTGWNEALQVAGFDFVPHGQTFSHEMLLTDWGHVARKMGRIPTLISYHMHGRYDVKPFKRRYGSWAGITGAFLAFAKGKRDWADVIALCKTHSKKDRLRREHTLNHSQRRMRPRSRTLHGSASPIPGRPVYGEPLNLPGLATVPVNETGVVYLFGILAPRLGFQVQSLRTAFPDCEARRKVNNTHWQTVTIEFEYESRNFRDHAHDPKGCDLIICWNHNWSDCPKNLEIISLKDALDRLKTDTLTTEFNPH